MNANQIKFLVVLSYGDKSTLEICKKLKIKPMDKENPGSYYSDLKDFIQWPSETEDDFEDKFQIFRPNEENSDEDVFSLTPLGETYILELKKEKRLYHLTFIGIIVGVIGIIVAIIA